MQWFLSLRLASGHLAELAFLSNPFICHYPYLVRITPSGPEQARLKNFGHARPFGQPIERNASPPDCCTPRMTIFGYMLNYLSPYEFIFSATSKNTRLYHPFRQLGVQLQTSCLCRFRFQKKGSPDACQSPPGELLPAPVPSPSLWPWL